jgi:hypothetical protein
MCRTCGGKFKPINNLKNQQILKQVKEVYDRYVQLGDNVTDLDYLELLQMWNLIYPNSSGVPSREKVLLDIQNSFQYIKVKR